METPSNILDRLNLAYDMRILELKSEFFWRVIKLKQYTQTLEQNVTIPHLLEVCKFIRDVYELAQADKEAEINTGIW